MTLALYVLLLAAVLFLVTVSSSTTVVPATEPCVPAIGGGRPGPSMPQ